MNKGIAFTRGLRGFPFLVWKRNPFHTLQVHKGLAR